MGMNSAKLRLSQSVAMRLSAGPDIKRELAMPWKAVWAAVLIRVSFVGISQEGRTEVPAYVILRVSKTWLPHLKTAIGA